MVLSSVCPGGQVAVETGDCRTPDFPKTHRAKRADRVDDAGHAISHWCGCVSRTPTRWRAESPTANTPSTTGRCALHGSKHAGKWSRILLAD